MAASATAFAADRVRREVDGAWDEMVAKNEWADVLDDLDDWIELLRTKWWRGVN